MRFQIESITTLAGAGDVFRVLAADPNVPAYKTRNATRALADASRDEALLQAEVVPALLDMFDCSEYADE